MRHYRYRSCAAGERAFLVMSDRELNRLRGARLEFSDPGEVDGGMWMQAVVWYSAWAQKKASLFHSMRRQTAVFCVGMEEYKPV
jgi:hypothetical protein